MQEDKILLSVDNVSVDFPNEDGRTRKTVLDHISFSVKSKEIVALVGESGSGKTILLTGSPKLFLLLILDSNDAQMSYK